MPTRFSSSSILCALALSFVVAPTFPAQAQTAGPADATSSNAAPAAPAPATPAPAAAPVAAPADTNAASSAAPEERPTSYTIAKGD